MPRLSAAEASIILPDRLAVIKRLLDTSESENHMGGEIGYEDGWEWAKEQATYHELRRLAAAWDARMPGSSSVDWLYVEGKLCEERFGEIISPLGGVDSELAFRMDVVSQEHEFLLDLELADSYIHGFAEGAIALWMELKEDIVATDG